MALLDPSWAIRMGVHFGLFASAINSQATPEQRQKWQRAVEEMQVIGCFAMTGQSAPTLHSRRWSGLAD
jgi:alkylation response protein AidB-like acyl-CoA dehydrogenase